MPHGDGVGLASRSRRQPLHEPSADVPEKLDDQILLGLEVAKERPARHAGSYTINCRPGWICTHPDPDPDPPTFYGGDAIEQKPLTHESEESQQSLVFVHLSPGSEQLAEGEELAQMRPASPFPGSQ